jgi:hypothetical protein
MLGSLALLLNWPIFNADPTCAGVPLSISPILPNDNGAAFCPIMLGSLWRLLKLPIANADVFRLPTLISPLSSARFDSTLLDLALALPRPSILG